MSGRPTSCSIRTTKTYRGIAYGARALWRRSARSSRRSHDLPGRPGKPATGRRGTGDRDVQRREACVMQSAETVLDVIRKRGERGLPIERLYRQLFNPQLYLLAYGRIYANKGAMTPGVTRETADGMSLEKIGSDHRRLARRTLPMVSGQAGLHREEVNEEAPAGPADLVGQAGRRSGPPAAGGVLRRPVLRPLPRLPSPAGAATPRWTRWCEVWKGTHWFIEGDISDCFGSLDHEVMLSILAEKIHDGRFLRLISRMLKAGYLEDWRWNATLSGAPQGGVASPDPVQYLPGPARSVR